LKILGLNLSPDTYTIPVYRNASHGSPDDEVEARYDLDRSLACSPDCFFVRVTGMAPRELGVLEGDLLLVEPRDSAAETDMRVYEQGGSIELRRASSPAGDGINARGSENGGAGSHYLGVARAVLRTLPRQ
jgi:SOS-response transcriptional repressor LexA